MRGKESNFMTQGVDGNGEDWKAAGPRKKYGRALFSVLLLLHLFGEGAGADLLVVLLHGGQILAYIRSNLWSMRWKTSAMAVELETMQTLLSACAKSPPGTAHIGCELMPHLKPVGLQSTNCTVCFALTVWIAWFTSLGTTSPRYSRQHDMNLPLRGSHLTIWFCGSNAASVISCTLWRSRRAFSLETMGAKELSMKWIRGYGPRLVWNSLMSTFSCPENRIEAVIEEMTPM